MFTQLIVLFLALTIAALPLHFTVKILGGRTHMLKSIFANILIGAVVAICFVLFWYASIIAFLAAIILYREIFRLKWWKAILAWFMQGFVAFMLFLIFSGLLGLSLLL